MLGSDKFSDRLGYSYLLERYDKNVPSNYIPEYCKLSNKCHELGLDEPETMVAVATVADIIEEMKVITTENEKYSYTERFPLMKEPNYRELLSLVVDMSNQPSSRHGHCCDFLCKLANFLAHEAKYPTKHAKPFADITEIIAFYFHPDRKVRTEVRKL